MKNRFLALTIVIIGISFDAFSETAIKPSEISTYLKSGKDYTCTSFRNLKEHNLNADVTTNVYISGGKLRISGLMKMRSPVKMDVQNELISDGIDTYAWGTMGDKNKGIKKKLENTGVYSLDNKIKMLVNVEDLKCKDGVSSQSFFVPPPSITFESKTTFANKQRQEQFQKEEDERESKIYGDDAKRLYASLKTKLDQPVKIEDVEKCLAVIQMKDGEKFNVYLRRNWMSTECGEIYQIWKDNPDVEAFLKIPDEKEFILGYWNHGKYPNGTKEDFRASLVINGKVY